MNHQWTDLKQSLSDDGTLVVTVGIPPHFITPLSVVHALWANTKTWKWGTVRIATDPERILEELTNHSLRSTATGAPTQANCELSIKYEPLQCIAGNTEIESKLSVQCVWSVVANAVNRTAAIVFSILLSVWKSLDETCIVVFGHIAELTGVHGSRSWTGGSKYIFTKVGNCGRRRKSPGRCCGYLCWYKYTLRIQTFTKKSPHSSR